MRLSPSLDYLRTASDESADGIFCQCRIPGLNAAAQSIQPLMKSRLSSY